MIVTPETGRAVVRLINSVTCASSWNYILEKLFNFSMHIILLCCCSGDMLSVVCCAQGLCCCSGDMLSAVCCAQGLCCSLEQFLVNMFISEF